MNSHMHGKTICNGSTVSSAFSALHLLKNYSLFTPSSGSRCYEPYTCKNNDLLGTDLLQNSVGLETTIGRTSLSVVPSSISTAFSPYLLQPSVIATVPPLMQSVAVPPSFGRNNTGTTINRSFLSNGIASVHRRPRSEKKPIPDNQKDEKYYERRKRNNQAAKKSRDARKIREDHIALRATMLEHENAILRAQVITLREEAQCLRHMLIKQQTPTMSCIEPTISAMSPIALSPPNSTSALDCQV